MEKSIFRIVMLLDNPFISDTRVEKEIGSFLNAGFMVSLICTEHNKLPVQENRGNLEIKRWIGDYYLHPFSINYQRNINELAQKIVSEKFQIIHCHDMFLLHLAKRIKSLKPDSFLSYDAHEYFSEISYTRNLKSILNKLKGELVWRYFLRQEKAIAKSANTIITSSAAISALLKQRWLLGITPSTVKNIPVLAGSVSESVKASTRSKLNVKDDELIMIQSGNIYQSINELKKVFQIVLKFEGLHLLLVNNKPIAKEISTIISENEKWPTRIHIVDYDSQTLPIYLNSSDFAWVFVNHQKFKSHYLTSPNRTFEYMSAALPIISVPQSISEELAKINSPIIIYDPYKADDFQNSIQRMIETLPEKKKNAERIKYALSWENEFRPVIELYKKVAVRMHNS